MGSPGCVDGTVLMGMPKSVPKSGWMLTLPSSAWTLVVQLLLTALPETSAFQASSAVNRGQPPLVTTPPPPPPPPVEPVAPPAPPLPPPLRPPAELPFEPAVAPPWPPPSTLPTPTCPAHPPSRSPRTAQLAALRVAMARASYPDRKTEERRCLRPTRAHPEAA